MIILCFYFLLHCWKILSYFVHRLIFNRDGFGGGFFLGVILDFNSWGVPILWNNFWWIDFLSMCCNGLLSVLWDCGKIIEEKKNWELTVRFCSFLFVMLLYHSSFSIMCYIYCDGWMVLNFCDIFCLPNDVWTMLWVAVLFTFPSFT